MRVISLTQSVLSFFVILSVSLLELNSVSAAIKKSPGLIQYDPATFAFKGLTVHGLKALKDARDSIRQRNQLFRTELRSLETLHHAGTVARLFKGNMFLYGPPGAAKSYFVNWLMRGETDVPFKLQLHQMITEQAFTGGQNFEAAKEGRFVINTKGSLADFAIALIDETDKGNPAALSSLLSLLNEREILAGNVVIKARLETLFATSNANLPEIFQQFVENGQGSTAPALLNRFQFKAFIYNWLSVQDQNVLDERREHRRYLHSLGESHPEILPEILKTQTFTDPERLDWVSLRQIAHTLFKPSPLFMTVYREFVNDMRNQTNRAIRVSEARHQDNPIDEPFVYFPSADYTERLRQQIPEVIIMSAFVDFLSSPLADDISLARLTSKQIELDPLSLWRSYLMLTTIGSGETKLLYDPNGAQKVTIDFNWSIDPANARDRREELLIQNLKVEQDRFQRTFAKHLASVQSQIQLRSRNTAPMEGATTNVVSTASDESFELQILQKRSE